MKNKKGFTLLELLIVMFIIGITFAIICSNYNYNKEKNQKTEMVIEQSKEKPSDYKHESTKKNNNGDLNKI